MGYVTLKFLDEEYQISEDINIFLNYEKVLAFQNLDIISHLISCLLAHRIKILTNIGVTIFRQPHS